MGWKKGIKKRRKRVSVRDSIPDAPRRFTVGEHEFVVKGAVDFECPFCGANMVVSSEPQAIMHGEPMCKKFETEDPMVFLRNARMIIAGPMPDDDEWPIEPPQDGKEN